MSTGEAPETSPADLMATGTRREALTALRGVLASSGVAADPEKRAPLAKQLADVIRELADLPDEKGASPVDDLASRRRARRSAAASGQ